MCGTDDALVSHTYHHHYLSLRAYLDDTPATEREREREARLQQSEPREHYGKRYASATYAKAQADTNLLGTPASITRQRTKRRRAH